MSKVSYMGLDEDIARLTERVKMAETSTTLFQLINGQISPDKAISKIYLGNSEGPLHVKKRR